jgi:hypothetical protein
MVNDDRQGDQLRRNQHSPSLAPLHDFTSEPAPQVKN